MLLGGMKKTVGNDFRIKKQLFTNAIIKNMNDWKATTPIFFKFWQ